MYTLTGSSWLPIPVPEASLSQKEPVLTQSKSIYQSSQNEPVLTQSESIYQSSQNEPIPPINSGKVVEFMDSSVESLLKEQIFLMKFILLLLGFMLLSNILAKKN